MNILNTVVSYWYECIKNEDILEKDISINVRKKAVLFPFNKDYFVFNREREEIQIGNERLRNFSEYIISKDYEAYYGYPILFYFDEESNKYLVAPLFIIKVKFLNKNDNLILQKNEQYPTCGIQAFNKLGLRTEEIADISQSLERFFRNYTGKYRDLAEKCLETIQKEAEIQINESIDPNYLSNDKKLSKKNNFGLYNKSLIFAGENTAYNFNLLKDLLDLKNKNDLNKTALSFLLEKERKIKGPEEIPVLPFPSNEYQIKALQDIFHSRLSVITGPPGTGKSQYISNLLVNLFLKGKKVLFVSHTNEAVNVVHQKINEQFKNLLMRTGKKDYRQELEGKFNELILDSEKNIYESLSYNYIDRLWKKIIKLRRDLLNLDKLSRDYERLYRDYKEKVFKFSLISRIIARLKRFLVSGKLKLLKYKLNKYPEKTEIESKIKELEDKYYENCQKYIKSTYLKVIIKKEKDIKEVRSFLAHMDSHRSSDESIDSYYFFNALKILKIWSSTLKSLRRTFPLSPAIFDYVIFDEASQIDLPSAAPALYRAKRAIVVGDPMQLTHVAGITNEIDKNIAKLKGLTEKKNIYPYRIRYTDISLYKSAESSLIHKPLFLTNHYRSTDQIITLCNQSFYKGRLKVMTNLDYNKIPNNLDLGIHWINCEGEVYKHPAGSRINRSEVEEVNKAFKDLLEKISHTNLTIGVVTPYSRQQDAIFDLISKSTPSVASQKYIDIVF